MFTRLLLCCLVALTVLVGCGGSSVSGTEELPITGLVARFEVPEGPIATSNDARVVYHVENRGPSPATIDLDVLGSVIMGLEVRDSSGAPVLTIPPGMPPADYVPRKVTLAPGERHRFEPRLSVFSPPLPRGTYTLRVRDGAIKSEVLHFVVSPGGP